MIKGKTSSGFEFTVAEGIDRDFRFMKAYRKVRSGDEDKAIEGAEQIISIVFSDKNEEERFYQHIASTYGGRIPIDVLFPELNEIIEIAKNQDEHVKNS